jgi:membrane associated rhomboid family serine protease
MITSIICVLTIIVSIACFSSEQLAFQLLHYPYREARKGEYWRMLTSALVHADYMHLIFNMLAFYSFGRLVEAVFRDAYGEKLGGSLYLLLYIATIIAADIGTYFQHRDDPNFRSVGASGGVSGIIFAAILFDPWLRMSFFIIPTRGIIFGIIYLVYSSWASNKGTDNIDHSAHYVGALFGFFLTAFLLPERLTGFIYQLLHASPYW